MLKVNLKKLPVIFLSMFLFVMVTCSIQNTQNAVQAKNQPIKIAFSNSYVGNAWRSETVKVFNSYCEMLKGKGVISQYYSSSSGNDPQAQINEIRNMMSQGYNAIVINAASPTALVPVTNEAINRGILIASFDNTVASNKVYNVNVDMQALGSDQAQWLAKELGGKGNILFIKGISGTTVTNQKLIGYNKVLAKYPKIKVLATGDGKWDEATTSVLVNNMLAALKGKQIDGILSEGLGEVSTYEALKQHGLDPTKIPMTGEMSNGFMRLMKTCGVKGFAAGSPPYLVAAAVDNLVKVSNGEKISKNILLPPPTVNYTEVDKWYQSSLPDTFVVSWTDKDNSYHLNVKDIIPDK
jgi:ribose transport system substrate-binding protein